MCNHAAVTFVCTFGSFVSSQLVNSVQVECGQCGLNENVYQTRQFEFDDSVLPFCDLSNTGSVQLYKIIGGVAGAIILVISIVWCARMLVRTVCRSSSAVSGGGRGTGGRRNDRDRGSQNSSARGRDARSCRSRSGTNDSSDPLQITAPMYVVFILFLFPNPVDWFVHRKQLFLPSCLQSQ